jgi:hypothetical protein
MDILKMLAELCAEREQVEEAIIVLRMARGRGWRRGRPPKCRYQVDGVAFGDTGNRSECFASQAFPDLGESGAAIANRNLDGSFALRIRFSAARYSFCTRRSWFTEPVTYASHTHFLFLMPTAYFTLRRAV